MSQSSKYPFDTMLVIFCVIAGASSHMISNASRITQNHLTHQRYRTSIIDLILDPRLAEILSTSNTDLSDARASTDDLKTLEYPRMNLSGSQRKDSPICPLLGNILTGTQMIFCRKHEEMLKVILPQVIKMTKRECSRITANLRWTCPSLEPFLDRSSSLGFTKEAALIRSLLNASMMYLIVKICNGRGHPSCGCQTNKGMRGFPSSLLRSEDLNASKLHNSNQIYNTIIDSVGLSDLEVDKLETGTPLRISRSMVQHQGCNINMAFAEAFTRIFFDADDIKLLNKAYKILNENPNQSKLSKYSSVKRIINSDQKDLSFLKWTKSAINLHNNHVGRQIVRRSSNKQCRCHGVSGACHFRTCWDKLHEFSEITSSLRDIYMDESFLVDHENLGTQEMPDLYLRKVSRNAEARSNVQPSDQLDKTNSPYKPQFDGIGHGELVYLYDSPDYCEAQSIIDHPGTRNRFCQMGVTARDDQRAYGIDTRSSSVGNISNKSAGSCDYLCCNRGSRSETVLYVVECNCGFRFCCKVECESCLRQQMRHYCR